MRNTILKISVAAFLLITTGCTKTLEKINIDPTKLSPYNMNYNYLFTSAELVTAGNSDGNAYEDWRNNLIYASCMIQHLSSTTGYWAGDKYTFNAGYNSAYWDANYSNSIRNIVDVIANIKGDTSKSNFYNIARIFKVFMFQRMTDMYGDIPYSQAGQGYLSSTTTPKYDKQQDIYADMLNELQDAAAKLDAGKTNTLGEADQIYGGDVTKWKKFAFSEMVRLAMRMSKVDEATAKTWVQKAVQGGVMVDNSDNALFKHQAVPFNTVTNGNAWVLDNVDANASRVSKTFIDYLKNTNDPRLKYIATVSSDPTKLTDVGDNTPAIQLGQPNGYDLGGSTTDISHAPNWPGDQNKYSIVNRNTFARYDAPTFFLTNAETQLLLAEAAERGWVTGSSSAYYAAGVTAAIMQLNQTGATLTDVDASAYLAANPYANGIQQINEQYWIVTFMDEYEAWANWRRSSYPLLTPVNYFNNITNGTIPRRFTYPAGEVTTNAAGYSDAVSRLTNGDKMTSRVWWDK